MFFVIQETAAQSETI